jgi:hypothetical protein
MILNIDNKGAIDHINGWTAGGRTRHIDTKMYFLREMKEQGIIVVRHVPGTLNRADLFTKNLDGKAFERHTEAFCGVDKYHGAVEGGSKEEDV